MHILAFDCAGGQCAAALTIDGKTIARDCLSVDRGHAQALVPLLQSVLQSAGLGFSDIDRFAVSTGPGSFTGIRVALATARGLSLGTGKPAVGVTCFEAYAAAALRVEAVFRIAVPPRLLVAIESRRASCFVQMFDGAVACGGPGMVEPAEIGAWGGAAGERAVVLAGNAAWRLAPFLPAALSMGDAQGEIDPVMVARLGAEKPVGMSPAPVYIRAPDAVPRAARQ